SLGRFTVSKSEKWNFAGQLVRRLGQNSHLTDAATGETLRGRDVVNSIVCFAVGFSSAGLQTGDRLLISCGHDPASTLAYLGAIYGGLVPVLIEDRALPQLGESMLAKAKAKAVWTATGLRRGWAPNNGVLQPKGNFSTRAAQSLGPAPCEEDDLAALMPTSGSTGVPRLVMVSHRNLIANTEAIVRSQHLGMDESAMLIMPVSYCFGASVVHSHLYQGGGVVF